GSLQWFNHPPSLHGGYVPGGGRMTSFPTPYTVQTEAYQPGATDPFGNPVEAWGPPTSQEAIGWAPPVSDEPKIAGHVRVIVDLELFVPPGFVVAPKDRVTVNGSRFAVVGYPVDTD